MWFYLGVKNFVVKKVVKDDLCDIFVCDFVHIWHKTLLNDELISTSQALNPLFEASGQKIKEITLGLFDENEQVQKEIKVENSSLILRLQSTRMGVRFQFQISLKQESGEQFYREFTLPLLLVMLRMRKKEKKLVKIIKEKDIEIEGYKEENPVMKKTFMTTQPFMENAFESEELLDPTEANIVGNMGKFLECIDKKLFWNESQLKLEQKTHPLVNKLEGTCINDTPCNTSQSVYKHKIINQQTVMKPCVNLGHLGVKKRKMQNNLFKIKF